MPGFIYDLYRSQPAQMTLSIVIVYCYITKCGIKIFGIRRTMSEINNCSNIRQKNKTTKDINILVWILHQRCTIVSMTCYVQGTCQLCLSQNNASSFPNKTTPTSSVNNGKLQIIIHKSMLPRIFSRLSESETLQSLGNIS